MHKPSNTLQQVKEWLGKRSRFPFETMKKWDALYYIQQLETRLAQVERERDALRQCICGDTIYKLITTKDGSGSIVEEQLCGFHYIDPPKQRSNKRGSYMIVYHESTGHITHLPVSQIGKTVFFKYEDAKTALDERRGVCEENTKEASPC